MGRQVRRVLPNWEHPVNNPCEHWGQKCDPCYEPLQEGVKYFHRLEGWMAEVREYLFDPVPAGSTTAAYRAEWADKRHANADVLEWVGRPPNPKHYTTICTPEEATWFQAYETVSEGTPVSPPFETVDELIDWIEANGLGGMHSGPVAREVAENFVKAAWAPSFIMTPGKGIQDGYTMHTESSPG